MVFRGLSNINRLTNNSHCPEWFGETQESPHFATGGHGFSHSSPTCNYLFTDSCDVEVGFTQLPPDFLVTFAIVHKTVLSAAEHLMIDVKKPDAGRLPCEIVQVTDGCGTQFAQQLPIVVQKIDM